MTNQLPAPLSSVIALPPEHYPLTVKGGNFYYKSANDANWTKLGAPDLSQTYNGVHQNCYSITFDSGVTLTQTDKEEVGFSKVKLILRSLSLQVEAKQLTVEAECVRIEDPVLDCFPRRGSPQESRKAIARAKTFPLADLYKENIAKVKLQDFNSFWDGYASMRIRNEYGLEARISALINRGDPSLGAAYGSTGPIQTADDWIDTPGLSNNYFTGPIETADGWDNYPGPSNTYFTGPIKTTNGWDNYQGPSSSMYMPNPTAATLQEQLDAQPRETANGEQWWP